MSETNGYGEPEDVEGECNAHLYIGDNFGDNHATMRCQRVKGHEGFHEERWGEGNTVTWLKDERDWETLPFSTPQGW